MKKLLALTTVLVVNTAIAGVYVPHWTDARPYKDQMQIETPLASMNKADVTNTVAISTRCTSAFYSAAERMDASEAAMLASAVTNGLAKWANDNGKTLPGKDDLDQFDRLKALAVYHKTEHGRRQGDAGFQADLVYCANLVEELGL